MITKRGKDFKSRLTSSFWLDVGWTNIFAIQNLNSSRRHKLILKGQRSKEERINIRQKFLRSDMNDGRRLAKAIEEIISQSLGNQL